MLLRRHKDRVDLSGAKLPIKLIFPVIFALGRLCVFERKMLSQTRATNPGARLRKLL